MLSIICLGSSLIIAFASLLAGRRRFALTIATLVVLVNAVSIALYYLAPDLSNVKITVATREITVYIFFVVYFVLLKRFNLPFGHLVDKVYLLLLLLFIAMILASIPKNSLGALMMGRELIFPVVTYFLFRFLNLDKRAIKSVVRLVLGLAAVTAILAIIEQIYVNKINPYFWEQIRVSGYLGQKYGNFNQKYPGSWVNYLPAFIGLPPGLRSIGLMLDPLVTGHFLACSFALTLYWMRGWKRLLFIVLVGTGALCTFSKGTMLICFVAIGSRALLIRGKFLKSLVLATVVLIVVGVGVLLLSTGDDSFTHFGSFKAGVNSLLKSPLGNGVGSTGYFNLLVTGEGAIEAIDTTFSVYVYQMGIVGLVALVCIVLVPFFSIFRRLRRTTSSREEKRLLLTCFPLFGAYSVLAFSSAAAFSAVPVFIPMMLLGMYVSSSTRAKRAKDSTLTVFPKQIGQF